MRLIPILNALLVLLVLYLLVFERDRLMGFAGDSATPAVAKAPSPPAKTTEGAVPVQAVISKARAVDQGVITRGQTESARRVELRAETTARVISEPQRKGQRVTQGDVLCTLDPGTRPAALIEAQTRPCWAPAWWQMAIAGWHAMPFALAVTTRP